MEEESSSLSEVIESFLPHTPSLVIQYGGSAKCQAVSGILGVNELP